MKTDPITDAELKPWRNAQAECLLAGFAAALIDGDDGRPMLVCSRWALTKAFTELQEFSAWLTRVRGKAAQ
jgi:predicted trehalose synthase